MGYIFFAPFSYASLSNKNIKKKQPVISSTISNQYITSFAEDEFGYIWISTIRGLNKYNNHEFMQYFKGDDSLSINDNRINTIFHDSKNNLWIATTNGICRYNAYNTFDRIPIEGTKGNVVGFCENNEGRLFINLGFELCTYNQEKNKFDIIIDDVEDGYLNQCFIDRSNNLWVIKPYEIRQYNSRNLKLIQKIKIDKQITKAYLNNNDQLILCSENIYKVFDTKIDKFIPIPKIIAEHPVLSKAYITNFYTYNNASTLINTEKDGLFLYNHISGKIIHQSESGFPFDVPNVEITTVFVDSNKNLWIGSHDQGFFVRYSYKERFNNNNFLTSRLKNNSVISMTKDNSQNLWIVTRKNGLFVYNTTDSEIKHFSGKNLFASSYSSEHNIKKIYADNQNNLWIISDRMLFKARYIQDNIKIEHSYPFPNGVLSITQDSTGTIWLGGAYEYLYQLKPGESEFKKFNLYDNRFTFTTILRTLSNNKIIVGSFDHDLQLINTKTHKPISISTLDQMKKTKFIPVCAYEDDLNNIWLGTLTNGLFMYSSKEKTLKAIDGATCSEISSITEDISGNIWIGTLYGLSKYDRTTGKILNFYQEDGLGGNQFNERCICRLNDNSLIFGGTHGLTSFNPINIGYKKSIPVEFEYLKINNNIVQPDKNGPVKKSLIYNPDIVLKHNQNSFTISFSAVDYSEYERVKYTYKLEGFDKIWIEGNNNHEAFYSNIPSGKYKFIVKTYNNEGTINSTVKSINIKVENSPWLSWSAILIYLVIFYVSLYFVIRTKKHLKSNLEKMHQAEREWEQEQRINKMNMSFFSNLSHEFRTPLTMISGPVSSLYNSSTITGKNKHLLEIIDHSIKRMLRLVNQLMDFNKLENDTLKLKVQLTNIIKEILNNIEIYEVNASEKGISINTYGLEDNFVMWLDNDKLEKIMSNIFSNALKFSLPNGKIDISFDVISAEEASQLFIMNKQSFLPEQFAKISIADTGIGVPEDKLEKIFDRYYQYENEEEKHNNWGTGIGLYYTRRLISLHHGYIKASNRENGGTTFTFLLPVDENAYSDIEKRTSKKEDEVKNTQIQLSFPQNSLTNDSNNEKILIIDDDIDVIHYLKTILSPIYEIHYKFNAENAYKSLKEIEPKLILCDVVMPGMDGYEFCSLVKNNTSFCHIPIILLTAKDSVQNQVEGLNTGADAYVIKPFEPSYLLALIHSQLNNRKKMQNLLKSSTKTEKIDTSILSPHDNRFMTDLYALMEKELSNPELKIESITKLLKISRTKFYYKVKGLTGSNPNVFFKSYKLNRAAELILEGEKNISEIADITGFNTLSHFSSSFKKHFGVSPKNYSETKANAMS